MVIGGVGIGEALPEIIVLAKILKLARINTIESKPSSETAWYYKRPHFPGPESRTQLVALGSRESTQVPK